MSVILNGSLEFRTAPIAKDTGRPRVRFGTGRPALGHAVTGEQPARSPTAQHKAGVGLGLTGGNDRETRPGDMGGASRPRRPAKAGPTDRNIKARPDGTFRQRSILRVERWDA